MDMRRYRPTIGVALLAALVVGCTFEVTEDEGSGLEASVRDMLERSAGAWNDGDLDAFLADYADAATTSFMTPNGPVRGLEAIRAGYAPAFAPDGRRDSLRFESLDVRQLPPLIGLVTARFVLERDGEITSHGWFTQVVRRVGNGWRIIHDHSSESPLPDRTTADPATGGGTP